MILEMDIGNSAIKWRLQSARGFAGRGSESREEGLRLPELAEPPSAVWVASVASENSERQLRDATTARWGVEPWFARSSAAACGVTSSYSEPEKLGVDRWLAMIAGWNMERSAVCVIDAGSALTIDFVADSGQHRGGYILPGLEMMERALLNSTDRVRFGDSDRESMEPGTSTDRAVFGGLQLAQVGAIGTALERYGESERLLFTGGNGRGAMGLLDRGGQYIEDLVLDGLYLLGAVSATRKLDGE